MFQGSLPARLARAVAPLAMLGMVLAAPGSAEAHREAYVAYHGAHPIPADHGGGWCNDHEQHFHKFEPNDYYLYSEYDGVLYFIGDPDDFGWTGTKYGYWDHHRIDIRAGGSVISIGYCYIPGPHYHYYEPPVLSYYHQYRYSGVYYYYWYDDLWGYPGYSRYYDTYYDYWHVNFPTYYPRARRHKHIDVSWGTSRKTPKYSGGRGSGYSKSGSGYRASPSYGSKGYGSKGYSSGKRGYGSSKGYGYGSGKSSGYSGSKGYSKSRGYSGSKGYGSSGNRGYSGSKGYFSGGKKSSYGSSGGKYKRSYGSSSGYGSGRKSSYSGKSGGSYGSKGRSHSSGGRSKGKSSSGGKSSGKSSGYKSKKR